MATATDCREDDDCFDPDELKLPESPEHRRVIDAIGVVASLLLEPTSIVYRDMNWYPTDGGNAVAPDLMVLAAGASVVRSYRQSPGGPSPSVVVEVPSRSDAMSDFFRRTARYRSLSVDCYAVLTDPGACSVLRFAAGANDVENWTGRPIAALGGLSIDVVDDAIVVVTPTGQVIRYDFDLSRDAERRVADLEARLRAAGIEP